jgi:hypothetical protein
MIIPCFVHNFFLLNRRLFLRAYAICNIIKMLDIMDGNYQTKTLVVCFGK